MNIDPGLITELFNGFKTYGEDHMAIGDFGNSHVTVEKAKLLEAMKKNLLTHRAAFLEAQEGYREQVIKELDKALKDAREGKTFRTYIELEAPTDHSSEYETIISMLEWSVDGTISVSQQQFNQFVLDKWVWSQQFTGTNARYSKKS
jgi:hypothetical protein